jgi:Ala-tRNA(Pro) deacylase
MNEFMDELRRPVFKALDDLSIRYESYEHPAVFNSEDADVHWRPLGGTPVKNLFLRNKKGDRHYLVVAEHRKPVDLQALVKKLGDDRLSFGSPERLQRHLGLTPGSVSPFGLINDPAHAVRVVIDADLRDASSVAFHPNVNTATLRITSADFLRFLESTGHHVRFVDL